MTETKQQEATDQPKFSDLALSDQVQQAIQQAGYDVPTAIQAEIIPHMLSGRDVLAQSQTGTGKTAAFALPILTRLKSGRRRPQVLVLTPTRELAIQVAKSFTTYGSCQPDFAVAAIYGGQDYEPQLKQLRRGVDVVVGTPGRVIDHIRRGTLDLTSIACLVLDEADEMLNMGFLEDVQFVLEQLPAQRQIALFSATLPPPIRRIADQSLSEPAKVTIKKKTMTADSIRQRALFVAPRDKVSVLSQMLEAERTDGVIVFTKTKEATVSVAEKLSREGLSAIALNGDMPQRARERAIDQLKNGRLDILVATDVAARGLDVSRISHVFNFDLPQDSESYIHRIGRTGRAGRSGEAIIFLTNAQRGKLRLIERATKQPIEVVTPPTADEINALRVERFGQQITETIAGQDLTMFKELITQYAEQSGQPLEMIAAALAQLRQRGRPFLAKPRREPERGASSSHDQPRRNRRERSGSDREFERSPRGKRRAPAGRDFGPPQPGMMRYRIEVGRQDGVKPGNIVGAVTGEAGIDGSAIGAIKINDSFSLIDLPAGMPSEVFHKLKRTWVAGKQLRLRSDHYERGPKRHRRKDATGQRPSNDQKRPGSKRKKRKPQPK